MSWYTINYGLGSICSFLLGLFVLYRGETRDLTRKTWFFLCVFVTLWHAGKFLIEVAQAEFLAQTAVYPIYVGAILIPPCYLHFILSLLEQEKAYRRGLAACYALAALELFLLFTGWLIDGVRDYPNRGFYEVPGRFYWLYVASYAVVPSLALGKLILAYWTTPVVVKRNQFKYVIFSSLIGFLGGATSFFPFVTSFVPPIGAPLVYFYTFPITYAVARYRLMDINVFIKKSLIYALQLSILLIPCYLLLMATQFIFFEKVSPSFSVFALILFICVGFFFPKLRFRTEEAFERVLFKKRYDYRATLLRSSREMVSMVDLETVCQALVQTVVKALGVEKASLFLLDESNGSFKMKSSVGLGPDPSQLPEIKRDEPLARAFMVRREALVREELEMADDDIDGMESAKKMGRLQAEITLPLNSKDRLIGLLNLGHREGKEMYSQEDIEVLSTLANQAAIAIENARLYENLKQSQSIIRRADRLSSLGMLTAGLAHEIRNPLVAIRTFTQLLPERYQDREFRDGFQTLALKEVDRICGLVNDLLSFARPSMPNVSAQDVNEIVENIARILETEAKDKDVRIGIHLAAGLPKIFIDKEQIKQVCMNLILNAIQSIEGGGAVDISTRLHGENGSRRFAQIEVRDTGIGIPEKDIENIFNPFFTTKKDGSGLGLSISHQIVKEHGGYIVVESQVGRGTAFFVRLPVSYFPPKEAKSGPQVNEENPGR